MQVYLVLALLFSLGVAIFALQNATRVDINLFIWQLTEISLVLVIFGSALIGAAAAGLFGIVKQLKLKKSVNEFRAENDQQQLEIDYLKRALNKVKEAEESNLPNN